MQNTANLYEKDFYAWVMEQADFVKEKAFNKLDLNNLVEEITDIGANIICELESKLDVLLMHLLKWKYQPTRRSISWELTIREQRKKIEKKLKKMPSLKSKIDEIFIDAYESATYGAARDTNLSLKAFPEKCEWTIKQVLDEEFYPS